MSFMKNNGNLRRAGKWICRQRGRKCSLCLKRLVSQHHARTKVTAGNFSTLSAQVWCTS